MCLYATDFLNNLLFICFIFLVMTSYHLRYYRPTDHKFDYIGSIKSDLSTLLINHIIAPLDSDWLGAETETSNLSPYNNNNGANSNEPPRWTGVSDEKTTSVKFTELQLLSNPSTFGAFNKARQLVTRYEKLLDDTVNVGPRRKYACLKDFLEQTAFLDCPLSEFLDPTTTTGGRNHATKSPHKTVSIGLTCLTGLLLDLNEKDSQLCCTALTSIFNFLNNLPAGDLRSEHRSLVDNLFQTLVQLRQSSTEEVATLASTCLLALATSFGATDLFLECAINFVSAYWRGGESSDSEYQHKSSGQPATEYHHRNGDKAPLCVMVPNNYLALYKMSLKALHNLDEDIPSCFCSGLKHGQVQACLNLKRVLNTVSDHNSLVVPNHNFSSMAADGKYLYLLTTGGLFKIGTGYGLSKSGTSYSQNSSVKAVDNETMLTVCAGSLYMKRQHSTRLLVFDCDTLNHIGEILLPATVAHNGVLCSDGTQFCLIYMNDTNDTLSVAQLDDTFQKIEKNICSMLLTEPHYSFSTLDSTKSPIAHQLFNCLGMDIVKSISQFFVSSSSLLTIVLTNDGRVFYAHTNPVVKEQEHNHHIDDLLFNNTNKWFELHQGKERWKHLSLSPDGQTLVLVSKTGHAFLCTDKTFNDMPVAPKSQLSVPNTLVPSRIPLANNKNLKMTTCNDDTIALLTENGKLFLLGKQAALCNPDTGHVIGLENVHIKCMAMGKNHTVVVTNHGYVYTFGSNNFGQCGGHVDSGAQSAGRHFSGGGGASDTEDAHIQLSSGCEPVTTNATGSGQQQIRRLCAPSSHVWKKQLATICTTCGLCSARGFECVFAANKPKGQPCGCGIGLSGCTKCGICRVCGRQYGAGGSEIDTESDGRPCSLRTPCKLSLPSLASCQIASVACGNYHTILCTTDGQVITFGSNIHGQLGTGTTSANVQPQQITLPNKRKARAVFAGSNHSVVLCNDGTVCTFGKNNKGQLMRPVDNNSQGRSGSTPFFARDYGPGEKRAKQVYAREDSTVIVHDQSLLSVDVLANHCFTANQHQFIIVPRQRRTAVDETQNSMAYGSNNKMYTLRRNLDANSLSLLINQVTISTEDCNFALDPVHNTLWSYNSSSQVASNYATHECDTTTRESATNFLKSLDFAIPDSKSSCVDDSLLGLNALATFYVMQDEKLRQEHNSAKSTTTTTTKRRAQDVEKCVERFQSFGGGWGYAAHSVEAIQFSSSCNITVLGFLLYGGRGSHKAKIRLLKIASDDESDAECLAEMSGDISLNHGTRRRAMMMMTKECGQLMFHTPVNIVANKWYTAWAAVSGGSTECGSNGMALVHVSEGLTFKFRPSNMSNNGTDVNVGQLPGILFKMNSPEHRKHNLKSDDQSCCSTSSLTNVQLNPDFFLAVTPSCYIALLRLVKLVVESSIFPEMMKESSGNPWLMEMSCSVVLMCLRILKSFTLLLYPRLQHHQIVERKEYVPYIENMFQILVAIIESIRTTTTSDPSNVTSSSVATVEILLLECECMFIQCFHVFFPSSMLMAHFFVGLMKNEQRNDNMLRIFTAALCTITSPLDIFANFADASSINHRLCYPILNSSLQKSRKIQSGANLDFAMVFQFLMELIFERPLAVTAKSLAPNNGQEMQLAAAELMLHLCSNFTQLNNCNFGGNEEHANCDQSQQIAATPKRFVKRSSSPNWDTGCGSADAISFQVKA